MSFLTVMNHKSENTVSPSSRQAQQCQCRRRAGFELFSMLELETVFDCRDVQAIDVIKEMH